MNLLKYPVEILYNIGNYLDIFDIMKLKNIDRYCYYVFNSKIDEKIREYLSSKNLETSNIDNIDNNTLLFYIHVIFYIKNCIEKGHDGILNITFMKIFCGNNNTKFNYKLFANVNNKCVYFLKNLENFCDNIDGLEKFLLKSKINNREIVKNDDISNITNVNDIIFLYRINYNEIIEERKLDSNEETRIGDIRKEDLIMVTFYFFL